MAVRGKQPEGRKCGASFRKDEQFHLCLPVSKTAKFKLPLAIRLDFYMDPPKKGLRQLLLAIKPCNKIKPGQVEK